MKGRTDGRSPPCPLSSPNSDNSPRNPLLGAAPPTPRPRSPLPLGPRPGEARGGRHPLPQDQTAKPAARTPSPDPRAGSGGPAVPVPAQARCRPGAPCPATHRQPSCGRAQGTGGRARTSSLPPGWSPRSEPTERQRPCLPGLSAARARGKHFRGSGGGTLRHRNCSRRSGRGLRGARGGASPPGAGAQPPGWPR